MPGFEAEPDVLLLSVSTSVGRVALLHVLQCSRVCSMEWEWYSAHERSDVYTLGCHPGLCVIHLSYYCHFLIVVRPA